MTTLFGSERSDPKERGHPVRVVDQTGGTPALPSRRLKGFTLVELLATVAIGALLVALTAPVVTGLAASGHSAHCANSLRQLAAATHMYLADNNQRFFPYYEDLPDGSRLWYFGREPAASRGGAEGGRTIEIHEAPLYPYIETVGKVEVCRAFPYGNKYWKPKFAGASYGYGYNVFLSPPQRAAPTEPLRPTPIALAGISQPSRVILFADCGQVNDFQAPASAGNPLLEEFYLIDDTYRTIHFRHSGRANVLFVDGHVERFAPYPGTTDLRIPGQILGRITPRRSTEYLK